MNGVLLLSGGMDSASVAYLARPRFALTIDYGQAGARAEIQAATAVARQLSISHLVLSCDLRALGLGRMAGSAPSALSPTPEWWPFRNQLLVTLAATHAIKCGADVVVIGTLATDATHADGTHDFLSKLDELLRLQEGAIRLVAPARDLNALELARRAAAPRSLLAYTHSCHSADVACGRCRGCEKRAETISQLGW